MNLTELRQSEAIRLVLDGKYTPQDLDRAMKNMKKKIEELEQIHKHDMAEIVRLRLWIEALEGE